MKYYKVVCVRAHQGVKNHKNTICFYFEARSALEAMNLGKRMPGVKHSRMPLVVEEVDAVTYFEGRKVSAYVYA